jgi:hypothetical protein
MEKKYEAHKIYHLAKWTEQQMFQDCKWTEADCHPILDPQVDYFKNKLTLFFKKAGARTTTRETS